MAQGTKNALVTTEHLSKWYGKVVGINDFTVTISPGVTGLLGPNGAGKSTFLKLLIGVLRPSKGKLTVLGERVWGNLPLLARIGYCPEHDGVYDDLTGREFVIAMARLSGLVPAEAARRADATLDRLGLMEARHRRLREYSKGMRQRVKLAQSLAHDPDLVLLDEPMTGCDPPTRVQLVKIIKELGAAGKAVIVSSHILHEVEAMTSEILLLYKGQVLAEGNVYRIREMIDRHPHKIEVQCDRPRELASELVTHPEIASVRFDTAGALLLETRDPDGCYPLIPRVALEHGVKIQALTSPDNNLQAVFEYLTRDRGPEGVARSGAGGAS
ncbi:MAG: ABC transporter ATP-binding protein [Deltaproteobacteria bacterium]|nr:ABC transporter ATP-binding protein [Deltaproteobacteria bacterium]